jgi:hypothetical protein
MYWQIHAIRDSPQTYLTKASPKLGILSLGIYCLLTADHGGIFYCTALCIYIPKLAKSIYNIRKDSSPQYLSNLNIIIFVAYTATYFLLTYFHIFLL